MTILFHYVDRHWHCENGESDRAEYYLLRRARKLTLLSPALFSGSMFVLFCMCARVCVCVRWSVRVQRWRRPEGRARFLCRYPCHTTTNNFLSSFCLVTRHYFTISLTCLAVFLWTVYICFLVPLVQFALAERRYLGGKSLGVSRNKY